MATTTPHFRWPIPTSTDPVRLTDDVKRFANAVDASVSGAPDLVLNDVRFSARITGAETTAGQALATAQAASTSAKSAMDMSVKTASATGGMEARLARAEHSIAHDSARIDALSTASTTTGGIQLVEDPSDPGTYVVPGESRFKPVGVTADGRFPARVEERLSTLGGRTYHASLYADQPVSLDATKARVVSSLTPCTTPTYEGSGLAVHPSVAHFPDGWNGWRYWMGMTPYPNADNKTENPSVLVSQDGTNWVDPSGAPRFIVPPDTVENSYHSDPYITMGIDGCLWMWWRWVDGRQERISYVKTADGLTWSEQVHVMRYGFNGPDSAGYRLMSPSVIQTEDGTWHMWAVDILPEQRRVMYSTMRPGEKTFGEMMPCTITGNTGNPWHIDVHIVGGQYQMLVIDHGRTGGELWAATSEDGLDWKAGRAFVPHGGERDTNALWYKSCFLPSIRDGVLGWDMWCSGARFLDNGPSIFRAFATFDGQADRDAAARRRTGALALKAGLPDPDLIAADYFGGTGALATASTGHGWSEGFTAAAGVAGPSRDSNTKVTLDTGSADVHVSVEVPAGARDQWVIARYVDASTYWRVGFDGDGWLRIQRIARSEIVQTRSPWIPEDGHPIRIGIRAIGDKVEGLLDGVKVVELTDPAPTTATRAGLQAATRTRTFKEFAVERARA